MALTLAERVLLANGMTHAEAVAAAATVTPFQRADAQYKKIAGEIIDGTTAVSSLPGFATFNPTTAQAREWCNRVLDGAGMTSRMFSALISAGAWDTDGAAIADLTIRNTCLPTICAFMAAI